jgi:AraC family transcriptional regulator
MIPRPDEEARDCGARLKRLWDLPAGRLGTTCMWHRSHRADGCGVRCQGFSPEFQVLMPYAGYFVWRVGRDEVVGDANQVLFVTGGESYRTSTALPGGYAYLIITPAPSLLSELTSTSEAQLTSNPLFRGRSRRARQRLQSFRARFLHWAADASDTDDLEAEEVVIALLRSALDADEPHHTGCSPTTAVLIRRAKEFLEAELSNSIRLGDVGYAVGASPAYLTDAFRRVEGVSLHRYLTQLRLARALHELPHSADLTQLALDVGFSSHSHFTASFRRRFGCTPSQFRESTRGAGRPSLP